MLSPRFTPRTGFRQWFLPRRFLERLLSIAGVAPSLSYLLLFLTKWRLVVSTPLIRGEEKEEGGYSNIRREEEGCSCVFGIVRKPVQCSFASLWFQSVGDSGAPPVCPTVRWVMEADWCLICICATYPSKSSFLRYMWAYFILKIVWFFFFSSSPASLWLLLLLKLLYGMLL